jgi:REP element-mobilizing transposase RayT
MRCYVTLTPLGGVQPILLHHLPLLPHRGRLSEHEFELLARVVGERRQKYHFLLAAWVFLPDHWPGIFFPRFPLTVSTVMEAIKVGSTHRLNAGRSESGLLWQPRFFDRALRTVREYYEQVAQRWASCALLCGF